jgi:hypothetical protein
VLVVQVLHGLSGSISGNLNLTLINGFGASDVESWSGIGVNSIIVEELAGYRDNTTFGWYDTTNTANSGQIFSGAAGPGANLNLDFSALTNFGFYINPNGSIADRMYTQNERNTHNDYQVAIFKIEESPNQYILGWEDLDLNGSTGGDRDYQDMIVRVSIRPATVPEPGTLALLGIGLLIVVALSRPRNRHSVAAA